MSDKCLIEKEILDDIANIIHDKNTIENGLSFPDDFNSNIENIYDDFFSRKIIIYKNDTITNIKHNAFNLSIFLKSIDLPNVTDIGYASFYACNYLESVNIPSVITIGESAFKSCDSLKSIDLPSCISIGDSAFENCTSLESVSIPLVTSINGAFSGCTSLKSIDLPYIINIPSYTFYNCTSLNAVILRSETMCTLEHTNAFTNSSIESGTGYVYVPQELIEDYKADSIWSTYRNQIRPIEGGLRILNKIMTFNSTQSVEVDIYKPIDNIESLVTDIQVTSSDETAVTISNINNTEEKITFDINSLSIEGTYTITVSTTIGEDVVETSFNIYIYETIPEPVYTVDAVDGTSYGFTLNDSGYYESTNKGVRYSAAVCKLTFNSIGAHNIYLDCVHDSTDSYNDYGILSNIDTTLDTTYSADTTNVFKSLKGITSKTVDYGVLPEGEHFIYIKFRKVNDNNASLQFKVRFELAE